MPKGQNVVNKEVNPYGDLIGNINSLKKLMANQDYWNNNLPNQQKSIDQSPESAFGILQMQTLKAVGNALDYTLNHLNTIIDRDRLSKNFKTVLNFLNKDVFSEDTVFQQYKANSASFANIYKDKISRIHERFITTMYNGLHDTPDGCKDMDELLNSIDSTLIENGFLTREDHRANMLSLMASSPDYNDLVYDRIKDVIKGGFNKEKCRFDLEDLGIDIEQDGPGAVYQLYFTSAQFKEKQMLKDDSFKSRVKGYVLPPALEQVKSHWQDYADPDQGFKLHQNDMKEVKKYMANLATVSKDKKLDTIDPTFFEKGIIKYEAEHHLQPTAPGEQVFKGGADLEQLANQNREGDLLKGIDSAFLNELAHNRGNFRSSNSPSYKAMGDALIDIGKKRANKETPGREDYEKLYNTCVEYMMQHDSIPTSRSGKKRFQAASVIAGVLAAKLDKSPLSEDADYLKAAMLRSRDFRDAYTTTLQRELRDFCDMNGNFSRDHLKKVQTLEENIMFCDNAAPDNNSKHMITEKTVPNDGKATKETLKDAAHKLSEQLDQLVTNYNDTNKQAQDDFEETYGPGKTPFSVAKENAQDMLKVKRSMPVPLEKAVTR